MINTDAYLLLGLTVVALILGGYVAALLARFANAHKTISVLEQLKNE
ncbi:MAG: hypothetical protein HXY40_03585 [Chloroflexi bacterium]|nr:hypothetical protein [Chloroflexota bacterium]